MPEQLTEFQVKALTIVRDNPRIIPSVFARFMWPDSPSWTTPGKCGPKGSTVGQGIRQCAGAKLSILQRAGLVRFYTGVDRSRYNTEYLLSDEGRRLLKEATDGS